MSENFDLLREQHRFHHGRLKVLMTIIIFFYIALLLRLAKVSLYDHDFWLSKRQRRFENIQFQTSPRKIILDKNNFVLATNLKSYSVGWQPQSYERLEEHDKNTLSEITNIPLNELDDRLQTDKKFLYLKRKIALTETEILTLKKIPGVVLAKEDKRFYPLEEMTSQLLGFTNIDNQGVEGIEANFNYLLAPLLIKQKKIVDAKGHTFSMDISEHHPQSLKISIDSRFQAILFKALEHQITIHPASSYSAVLLDTKKGSLAGVVSYPSFNPNKSFEYASSCRLKPFLDLYEPGSVIKPFSVACVLDAAPNSLDDFHIKTAPGYLMLDHHKIVDVAKREELDLKDILLYSSNIGLTRLLHAYPECQLQQFLMRFGVNQLSGFEYSQEASPNYPQRIKKGSFVEATLGFGYGLQMNLVQLARAYSVFANNGELIPITLLDGKTYSGEQVISSDLAAQMRSILAEVVQHGSARGAYHPKYPLGGKTGTAQKVGDHGYEQRYNSFFACFFPVQNPRYVLVLHADEPTNLIYGGQICAPLAKKIIPQILGVSEHPSFSSFKESIELQDSTQY